jgi:hypothetical protein
MVRGAAGMEETRQRRRQSYDEVTKFKAGELDETMETIYVKVASAGSEHETELET